MTERFGPHGHDYKLCNDAGPSISPLSDDEIHKRIAERLRCKLNRDFERADEIKVDLMVKDVAIDDVSKLWRADGFLVYVARGHNNKLNYTYAPDAGPSQATMTDEEVVKLLAVRHECRQNRDFAGADFIRVDLWEAGVQVDDVNRLWRADGTSFRDENRDVNNGDKDLFGDSAVFRGDKLDG
jgi:cysteinyl-tRNA synthetase